MLSDFAYNQDEIKTLLMKYSSILHEFLQSQVALNIVTEDITSLKWPIENDVAGSITFKKKTSQVSQQEIQEEVNSRFKNLGVSLSSVHEIMVEIKVLNADWLLAGESSFADFCGTLECCNSQRIYDCELMSVLVNANWEYNQSIIINYCFIPWALYAICTVFSFQEFLINVDRD